MDIVVPDEDTATLAECLDQIYVYDPPAVGRAQYFAREAGKHADRAEAGADRVGSAEQAGAWVEEATTLRGDTVEAADRTQTQAGVATEQAGFARAAAGAAAEDARRAETARQCAETIQQEIPDKIDQELETKLPGELDTRVPAELDKHLPGELDERVPPMVASSIADDRTVADAAAAAIEGAVDEAMPTRADTIYVDQQISEAQWYKGSLGDAHLDTVIDTGLRDQLSTPQATLAQGYPVPVRGYLVTVRQSTAIASQTYSTTSGTVPPSQWTRTTSNAHSDARTWGPWIRTNRGAQTLGTADLDTATAPDDYVQGVGPYATRARNYPEMERGNLKVTEITRSHIHQAYLTASATPKLWTRSRIDGAWEGWALVSGGGSPGGEYPNPVPTDEYPGNPYAHHVRELNLRRRMGHVTTGGKAAVTMIFDHGTKNWRDVVQPALIQRGLRATLALNGSLMENGVERWGHDPEITWGTIKSWHNAGMEIANHGMYHDDAPDVASQLVEIRDSREKLEAELGITIPQGPIGQWLDRGDQNARDNIVSAIDHAVAVGGRTIIRCHPQYMGMPNMFTEKFLFDFLDYLKGRVDAGDLVVLPANKWAIAQLRATELQVNGTGWQNINHLTTVHAEGDIDLIRIGNQVTMKFTRFAPTADLGQWGLILTVPTGYRPDTDDIRAIPVNNSPGAQDTLWQNYRSGQLRMSNHQDVEGLWNMSVSWITHEEFPTTPI